MREVSALTLDGATLAQQAFSVKNPILAFSDIAAFAKGVRNPLAHTHGKLEEQQKAFDYLCLASLFCRRIDEQRANQWPQIQLES